MIVAAKKVLIAVWRRLEHGKRGLLKRSKAFNPLLGRIMLQPGAQLPTAFGQGIFNRRNLLRHHPHRTLAFRADQGRS